MTVKIHLKAADKVRIQELRRIAKDAENQTLRYQLDYQLKALENNEKQMGQLRDRISSLQKELSDLHGKLAGVRKLMVEAESEMQWAAGQLTNLPDEYARVMSELKLVPEAINPKDTLTEEERSLVRQGKWIEAIKSVRQRLNIGLKDAKDFVEKFH